MSYSFAQEPRPIRGVSVSLNRAKYRDPNEEHDENSSKPSNMMWDKRIIRGSTYAAPTASLTEQDVPKTIRPRSAKKTKAVVEDGVRALKGRHHMEIQTDPFLEELDDDVYEAEYGTQTDFPDELVEIEAYKNPYDMRGDSKFTSIEEGEVFDFDAAVQPIVSTLIGKSLDHGLAEVLEEEELKEYQTFREQFQKSKDQIARDVTALEDAARAAHEDKMKLLRAERARFDTEHKLATLMGARHIARAFLCGLQNTVTAELTQGGFFTEPAREQATTEFLPWLAQEVAGRLEALTQAQVATDSIVLSALGRVLQERSLAAQERERKLEQERESGREHTRLTPVTSPSGRSQRRSPRPQFNLPFDVDDEGPGVSDD